jgi:hypothetical protein
MLPTAVSSVSPVDEEASLLTFVGDHLQVTTGGLVSKCQVEDVRTDVEAAIHRIVNYGSQLTQTFGEGAGVWIHEQPTVVVPSHGGLLPVSITSIGFNVDNLFASEQYYCRK